MLEIFTKTFCFSNGLHWCETEEENTGIVEKILELSVPFIYNFPLIKLMYHKKQTASFFFGWASRMFHKSCSVSVCFHLQYFPLNKLRSTRGFLPLFTPSTKRKLKKISGNGSNFHSYSFEGTIRQLCWGVPRCKKSQLWLSNLVLCM